MAIFICHTGNNHVVSDTGHDKIQQILTVIIMMILMMKVMGVMLMSDSRNGGW